MYPGTEELLSIRDGEPVDAEVRAAVDAEPSLQAEVERLQATRDRLRELPELAPPPGVRAKVFAQLESGPGTTPRSRRDSGASGPTRTAQAASGRVPAEGTARNRSRFRFTHRAYWPLRGAIAAAVAVVAVLAVRSVDEPTVSGPGTIVAEGPVSNSSAPGLNGATAAYTSLTSESARLERLLNRISYRPRLVNAATATTITGLQDRIARVDQVLMYSSVNGLRPEQTEALWQERVDLMNALLQVRYAQAQRFGF